MSSRSQNRPRIARANCPLRRPGRDLAGPSSRAACSASSRFREQTPAKIVRASRANDASRPEADRREQRRRHAGRFVESTSEQLVRRPSPSPRSKPSVALLLTTSRGAAIRSSALLQQGHTNAAAGPRICCMTGGRRWPGSVDTVGRQIPRSAMSAHAQSALSAIKTPLSLRGVGPRSWLLRTRSHD